MPAYPGLPAARVGLHLDHATSRGRYQGRAEFAIGRLEMVGNVGTYLNAPYHRFPDAVEVAGLPLEQLVDLPTVVVDAREDAATGRRLDLVLPPTAATRTPCYSHDAGGVAGGVEETPGPVVPPRV